MRDEMAILDCDAPGRIVDIDQVVTPRISIGCTRRIETAPYRWTSDRALKRQVLNTHLQHRARQPIELNFRSNEMERAVHVRIRLAGLQVERW